MNSNPNRKPPTWAAHAILLPSGAPVNPNMNEISTQKAAKGQMPYLPIGMRPWDCNMIITAANIPLMPPDAPIIVCGEVGAIIKWNIAAASEQI